MGSTLKGIIHFPSVTVGLCIVTLSLHNIPVEKAVVVLLKIWESVCKNVEWNYGLVWKRDICYCSMLLDVFFLPWMFSLITL